MENRGTWTDLIAGVGLEIAEVFDLGQEQYIVGIGNVLTTTTGAGAERNFTGKTGLGELYEFTEGDDVPLRRRYKTYTTKVTYNGYGNGIQVTKYNLEDRDFDAQLDEMKDMSIAANFAQDKSGLQLFNGGFSTTAKVNGYTMTFYADGVPTYSTVHPTVVPGGSTQSNASSTSISFGHDSLETAHIALIEQKTDDGLPLALLGKPRLVVAPSLSREAREETESALDPETANNAINVFTGGVIDVATSTHLAASNGGSDTAWFLIVPGRDKQCHEVRQAPQLESDVDILSKTATFTVDARWADYVKDWRRKYGSKGDLTTYSS